MWIRRKPDPDPGHCLRMLCFSPEQTSHAVLSFHPVFSSETGLSCKPGATEGMCVEALHVSHKHQSSYHDLVLTSTTRESAASVPVCFVQSWPCLAERLAGMWMTQETIYNFRADSHDSVHHSIYSVICRLFAFSCHNRNHTGINMSFTVLLTWGRGLILTCKSGSWKDDFRTWTRAWLLSRCFPGIISTPRQNYQLSIRKLHEQRRKNHSVCGRE